MEERNDMDKIDDVLMPGFRFHPTDEELVDFYLKRKIQKKSLPIELIKQVDIYKYDPWDLPKLASSGEKECYFYCPRERKYKNSDRPNRVTTIGFWKATGIDRLIYSSKGKCVGLKKSLVFYIGRAINGTKTDWMMHEFRLPCIPDLGTPKKHSDKSLPASDSWAICRIFKKTNSTSMAQKALSQPWFSHLPGSMVSDTLTQGTNCNQLSSENISCTTEIGSSSIQFCSNNKQQELNQAAISNANTNFSSASDNIPSYTVSKSSQIPVPDGDFADSFNFYNLEATFPTTKSTLDATNSMISNLDHCICFEEPNQQYNSGFSICLPQDMQANMQTGQVQLNQWELGRTIGFPFNLPSNDAWKPTFPWDSHPCPSEMHTTYSTNKYYT